MKAFKGLLWKDYCISRFWFFGWLALLLFLYTVGVSVAGYFGYPEVSVFIVFLEGIAHLGFMPLMLLSILMIEGRTQLWLHTTQESWKLLLSKLIIVLGYSVLSLLLVDLLGVISLSWQDGEILFLPWKESIFFNFAVTSSAAYFSCWVLFYWTVFYGMATSPLLKKFRWFILVFIFIFYQLISSLLMTLAWVREFTNLWTIKVRGSFFIEVGQGAFDTGSEFIHLPVIPFLIYAVIMVILFLAASWVLERKVEV
jgi:hypothetical protein